MVPYPNAAGPVGPVNAFPASILNGDTYDSGIMVSHGANISVWAKATHDLTLKIDQYADPAGAILVQETSQAISANTLTNKSVADGKLFGWFKITLANASGSTAVINNLAILQ
jgi:hypothetical protein